MKPAVFVFARLACLVSFVALTGVGCRLGSSDAEKGGSKAEPPTASYPPEIEEMSVERCGVGFQGQIIAPAGGVVQEATAQTTVCSGDECSGQALAMISLHLVKRGTCVEIREKLALEPIVDAWGARARVTCNGDIVQAVSAGRDGKLGTCDDLARFASLKVVRQ